MLAAPWPNTGPQQQRRGGAAQTADDSTAWSNVGWSETRWNAGSAILHDDQEDESYFTSRRDRLLAEATGEDATPVGADRA